jgi:hypothetical protein
VSARMTSRELHLAHEDSRNEAAHTARLVREGDRVRVLAHELAARRMEPCLATSSRVSDDFAGCVE